MWFEFKVDQESYLLVQPKGLVVGWKTGLHAGQGASRQLDARLSYFLQLQGCQGCAGWGSVVLSAGPWIVTAEAVCQWDGSEGYCRFPLRGNGGMESKAGASPPARGASLALLKVDGVGCGWARTAGCWANFETRALILSSFRSLPFPNKTIFCACA